MAARLGVTELDVKDAAWKVVRSGRELTVAAVAKEAGIQPPSLYHHVPDGLFGLYEGVMRRITKQVLELVDMADDPRSLLTFMHRWAQMNPILWEFWLHQDGFSQHPLYEALPSPYHVLIRCADDRSFPLLLEKVDFDGN